MQEKEIIIRGVSNGYIANINGYDTFVSNEAINMAEILGREIIFRPEIMPEAGESLKFKITVCK